MPPPNLWQIAVSVLGLVLGLAGVAALAVAIVRSKDQARVLEILKEELSARKDQFSRVETERNDYRDKLHASLGELGEAKLRNVELQARTDFVPVLKYQQEFYEEQTKFNRRSSELMDRMVKTLERLDREVTKNAAAISSGNGHNH